jgi:alkanesulfonate monooxygenase SsuD/methylene tetrahydromethanopterin reductase-like flavin-dependent oxidoreductase (luciferase family)
VRLSTVILPVERWPKSREKWRRAEELGFYAAYTYDHLSWRSLADGPWFGAVPTLTAAALETSTIRLGTLVASPNFRHPVPLAKDLLSIDDVSDGRLIIGIGAGGLGNDATVLGGDAWTAKERSERFSEFVELLDQLLREGSTTMPGRYYAAREARMFPGTIQRPRPPFCIAASGPRGFSLVAHYAQAWVSVGTSRNSDDSCFDTVSSQLREMNLVLDAAQRPTNEVEKVLLDGLSDEKPLESLDAFVEWASRYKELGITELVVHWPEPASVFESNMSTFERIAADGLSQLSPD